ncbi:hypothetical protein [Planktotalea sp.]|uniref:hypothetical protein n=1 Tax=Planktotalea sp. TaxID=2029877 RepID=UPI0032998309
MTFQDATMQLPTWVQIWMNILLLGAFIMPLSLLIWKQTRITGVITFVVSVLAGFTITLMYDSLGMVRLLGLPHVLLWTPLLVYLIKRTRADLPAVPKGILYSISATIFISLLFDYYDVIRYLLGDTASTI